MKRFLREGLDNTSVTCVLAGTRTWERRSVRYEIARRILKGNGLLTLHIHGVKDKNGDVSVKGENPLDYMGVYRTKNGISFAEFNDNKWVHYSDYKNAINEKYLWFSLPASNNVVRLSKHFMSYDFVKDDGRSNISSWIEAAAKKCWKIIYFSRNFYIIAKRSSMGLLVYG